MHKLEWGNINNVTFVSQFSLLGFCHTGSFFNQFIKRTIFRAVFLNQCVAKFFCPYFYSSFVENEEILVAISNIELFFWVLF